VEPGQFGAGCQCRRQASGRNGDGKNIDTYPHFDASGAPPDERRIIQLCPSDQDLRTAAAAIKRVGS